MWLMANCCRLDKDLFVEGLKQLQTRIETRFYVTVLSFATDLCEVIRTGIVTPPDSGTPTEDSRSEHLDALPVKNTFTDIRERRKLGKRILKAVQPSLEAALRVESEISQKPFEGLQHELESMVDRSIEAGRLLATASQGRPTDEANDTIMVDAELQITVKADPSEGDVMDTTPDGEMEGGNIEVSTNIDVDTSGLDMVDEEEKQDDITNAVKSSDTPPDTDGYVSKPRPAQSGPPTPPQSNGSLGLEPLDPLTEGGVLWYLKGYEPQGTSVLGEHWAGRDAVRMLSEDLTDMDEEELKGLGMVVDQAAASVVVEADEAEEAESVGGKTRASKAKKRRTSTRRR